MGGRNIAHMVGERHSTNDRGYTYLRSKVQVEGLVPVVVLVLGGEVEEKEGDGEGATAISNVAVSESTVSTFPLGKAWKMYPHLPKV